MNASESSWDEIELKIKESNQEAIVIIPLGAIRKEHGRHLPLGTDAIQANYYASRLEKDSLFHTSLPMIIDSTVTINYFPAFVEYPGTLSLQFSTACQLIEEISEQWFHDGIQILYFINLGISTNRVLQAVKEKLENKYLQRKQIFFTNLKIFDQLPEIHSRCQEKGTHAGQLETSSMLYLESIGFFRKGLIKMHLACDEDNEEKDPLHPGRLTRNPNAANGVYSASGVWGNATLASVELGEFYVNRLYDYIQNEILSAVQVAKELAQKN